MALNNTKEDKIYASVLADGKIHVTVPETEEGAQRREYETSDGKTGVKFEKVYTELIGMITNVSFFEGDFGKSLQITVVDGDEKPVVLSLSTQSNYGEDMMKKLPNINLEEPVKLAPYSFTDDNGKGRKGITVMQGDTKLTNYFYDPEAKKNVHGYPTPKPKKGKPYTKDEWKLYFMEARIFLIDFITEKFGITSDTVSYEPEPQGENESDANYKKRIKTLNNF